MCPEDYPYHFNIAMSHDRRYYDWLLTRSTRRRYFDQGSLWNSR
jgi:hypothetical protein